MGFVSSSRRKNGQNVEVLCALLGGGCGGSRVSANHETKPPSIPQLSEGDIYTNEAITASDYSN